MKSKLCWIPFIPLTIAATVLQVLQTLGTFEMPSPYFFTYIASYLLIGMFAVNIVFTAIDKKTSPVYLLTRNVPAAVCAMLAAATIASKSALIIILDIQNRQLDAFVFATVLMGMLAAVCMVFVAMAHLQGRNFLPRMGMLFLSMPVWAGMMLISEFLSNRTVSVLSINPFKLFAFAFAMVFLFKLSMIIATVNGKNPVKAMYLYGLPLAGFGIAYGVGNIVYMVMDGIHYSENITAFIFLSLALYIICFNIELTRLSRTNEEQLLKFDLDDYEEEIRAYGNAESGILVQPEEQTGDYDYDYEVTKSDAETYITEKDASYQDEDTDDYVYGYYGYGAEIDAEHLVVAPDAEDDDAIYVDSNVVDKFEEKLIETDEDKKGQSGEKTVSPAKEEKSASDKTDDEQLEKINRILEDI